MKKKLISSMFLFGIIVTSFSNYLVLGLNAAEMDERIEYVPKNSFKFWNPESGVEYKKDEIVIQGLEKKKVIQNFTANGDDNWWNAPSLFELVEVSTPEDDVIEIEVILGELNASDLANIYNSDGISLADVENKIEIQENISSTPTLRGVSLSSYFKSAYWVSNKEGPTLSVDPHYGVRQSYNEWPSWNALADRQTGFGNYYAFSKSREALFQQYVCHQDFAWYKTRWNLDTWRPHVSSGYLIYTMCNP